MAALTEEQSILKDQATSWVETELPVQKFREFRNSNSDGGFDPKETHVAGKGKTKGKPKCGKKGKQKSSA